MLWLKKLSSCAAYVTLQFKWPNGPESSDRTTFARGKKPLAVEQILPSTLGSLPGIYNFERVVGRKGKGEEGNFCPLHTLWDTQKTFFQNCSKKTGEAQRTQQAKLTYTGSWLSGTQADLYILTWRAEQSGTNRMIPIDTSSIY